MAAHDWKPATRHSYRCTLRVFFAWAVSVGVVDVNPTDGLPGVKMTPPSPRPVPEVHYRAALLGAPDREHLMMRLAAEAGLRRAEVAQVHSSDIEPDLGGWTLTVHGKGGKVRRVPLKATLARELRALPAGFAFPGRIEGHVSPAWVGKVVSRCLPLGYSMHKLRHRFGTVVYAVDHDLFSVQDLLGHASPETTRAYVMVDPTAKRRLVEAA
jgi:integrase